MLLRRVPHSLHSGFHPGVHIYQTLLNVHFKYLSLILHELYFNEVIKNKNEKNSSGIKL